MEKKIHQPTKTITKVKAIHLMEGDVHTADIAYGFTGLILEMADGRIVVQHTTDPMQAFSEVKTDDKNYEQLKALLA